MFLAGTSARSQINRTAPAVSGLCWKGKNSHMMATVAMQIRTMRRGGGCVWRFRTPADVKVGGLCGARAKRMDRGGIGIGDVDDQRALVMGLPQSSGRQERLRMAGRTGVSGLCAVTLLLSAVPDAATMQRFSFGGTWR